MLAGKPTMTTCLNVISCSMNYCSSFPLISAAHRHSAQPAHSRVSVSPSLQGTTTHNAFQCFPSHPLSLFFFFFIFILLFISSTSMGLQSAEQCFHPDDRFTSSNVSPVHRDWLLNWIAHCNYLRHKLLHQ